MNWNQWQAVSSQGMVGDGPEDAGSVGSATAQL